MTLTNDIPTLVQERAAALREELQRWLQLTSQVEQHAGKTQDATSLQLLTGFLSSARKTVEQAIEPDKPREYPFMPVAEAQEISLPSFPLPGKGTPVKSRPGGVRLPDPAFFPKE